MDTDRVVPIEPEQNDFVRAQGLEGKFLVQYSGNIGRAHGADVLADVAEGLSDLEDVVVLIIGEGPAREELQQDVESRELKNVRFLPYQPKSMLSQSLSASHVSLVLQRAETAGLVVPSKLYGIMSAGRPVLAAVPEGCEVERVVNAEQIGRVVRSRDVRSIVDAIRSLHADSSRREAMGLRARAAAERDYARSMVTRQYIDLFNELAG